MIGDRTPLQILNAVLEKRHYTALANMMKYYPDFAGNLFRYLTAKGQYPYNIKVKTPCGVIAPELFSHHDILTVNEIFCRLDYFADESVKTVVDLGSNIGISALYFLTRNSAAKCYLFEPNQKNVASLKENLTGYESRYSLSEKAVSNESGVVDFGTESTGRYGGIDITTKDLININKSLSLDKTIKVECLEINSVLEDVLSKEKNIDILKIDTEGVEEQTVHAIKPQLLKKIKRIYMESTPAQELHAELFEQKQFGSVYQMINKQL